MTVDRSTLSSLLLDLGVDFYETGKKSIKDCLRSKAMPARKVKKVLQARRIGKDEIQVAHAELTGVVDQIKWDILAAPNLNQSSLSLVSQIATVCYFIQLILEVNGQKLIDAIENTQHNHDGTDDYSKFSVDDPELNKIVLDLTRSLVEFAHLCLEKEKSRLSNMQQNEEKDDLSFQCYESDASTTINPFQVASFIFGSLLRLNHYVRERPFLLTPIWKGLCDIIQSASTTSPSQSHVPKPTQMIPNELILEACKVLCGFLKEGTEAIVTNLEKFMSRGKEQAIMRQEQKDEVCTELAQHQVFQIKILTFLVGRLSTIMCSMQKRGITNVMLSTDGNHASIIKILTVLCGFDLCVEAQEELPSARMIHSRFSEEAHNFSKISHLLSTKAEKTLQILLFDEDLVTKNKPVSILLDILLAMESWTSTVTSNASDLSLQCFILGRVKVFARYLSYLNEAAQKEWYKSMSQDVVELVLQICRDILCYSLPSFSHVLSRRTVLTLDLVTKSIALIGVTLIRCEIFVPCIAVNADPGRRRFHQMLFRWFLPEKNRYLHPMAIETLVTLFQLHFIALHRLYNKEASLPFFILLIKLCFDYRTVLPFRRRLSALLLRLHNSLTFQEKQSLSHLVIEEITQIDRLLRTRVHINKKRKRGNTQNLRHSSENLTIVAWIISSLPYSAPGSFVLSDLSPGCSFNDPILNYEAFHYAAMRSVTNQRKSHFPILTKFLSELCFGTERENNVVSTRAINFFGKFYLMFIREECIFVGQDMEGSKANDHVRLASNICCVNKQHFHAHFDAVGVESIALLGSIGKVLKLDCPKSMIENLSHSFRVLLSSESWVVRSFGISALLTFASTVISFHKDMLTFCLPNDQARLSLQCRLQNVMPTNDGMNHQKELLQSIIFCRLQDTIKYSVSNKIFPAVNSLELTAGSYLMTMPTQEGRTAVVIFPPGNQSLEDIKYMLAIESDDTPAVYTIKRTNVASDGVSCKIHLSR